MSKSKSKLPPIPFVPWLERTQRRRRRITPGRAVIADRLIEAPVLRDIRAADWGEFEAKARAIWPGAFDADDDYGPGVRWTEAGICTALWYEYATSRRAGPEVVRHWGDFRRRPWPSRP